MACLALSSFASTDHRALSIKIEARPTKASDGSPFRCSRQPAPGLLGEVDTDCDSADIQDVNMVRDSRSTASHHLADPESAMGLGCVKTPVGKLSAQD